MGAALVRGRYVITGVDQGRASVVEDGAVFRVTASSSRWGRAADLSAAAPADECWARPITWCCPASSTATTTWG